MSMQALGWLGKSLGVNISGRSEDPSDNYQPAQQGTAGVTPTIDNSNSDQQQSVMSPNTVEPTVTQQIGGMMNTIGNALFGGTERTQGTSGGHAGLAAFGTDAQCPSSSHQSQETKPKHPDDTVDFDENGLPRTRNWYKYDETVKMWVVTEDAPENVRKEYEEKQREREDERLGITKVIAPPPPPGPALPSGLNRGAAGPLQYADNDFFTAGARQQPALVPSGSSPHSPMPIVSVGTPAGSHQPQLMPAAPVPSPYPSHSPMMVTGAHAAGGAGSGAHVPMMPAVPHPAGPSLYTPMALPYQTVGLAGTSTISPPTAPPFPVSSTTASISAGSLTPPSAFPKPPSFPVPPY